VNKIPEFLRGSRVLVVDDVPANLDVLSNSLESTGYQVQFATSGEQALRLVSTTTPDLILLDVMMPGMDGYEVCRRLKSTEKTRDIPVLFITAQVDTGDLLRGFDAGGVDYITKPFREEEVLIRVQTHLRINYLTRVLAQKNGELAAEIEQRKQLKGQLSTISQREAERWGLKGFVGTSATVQKIFSDIRLMQEHTATSVLITGESGTGKELIARAIHYGSPRAAAPFVPVNCAALPADLAESLLFGHVKGAFTGATDAKAGYFETAHQGTLFLDEMGDMPLELQAKLLRVLEDGEVRRIGDSAGRKVDVRILAATNAQLQDKIQQGAFRQDLYFRLARFVVEVPPLRQRREDIALLVEHFMQLFAEEMGRDVPAISQEALECLAAHSFPGNIRELKNIVERALIESRGAEVQPPHLYFAPAPSSPAPAATAHSVIDLPLDLKEAELWVIKRAIAACDGNLSEAARLLNTHRNKIYRALAQEEQRELL